jgi:hypothetical protein
LTRANLRRKWSTTISKTTDNLSKAGWSCGCVSAIDSNGRTIWIVNAHRDNGKRFVARSDEKLTAFLELEKVTRESVFETPGVEPVFREKRQAIDYTETRACAKSRRRDARAAIDLSRSLGSELGWHARIDSCY